MDIVFCKTRADPEFYRSYTDFWTLVGLAEFPVIWLDELEPGREAVYIVTPRNGELPPILPRLQGDHACKFVWWCLERPEAQGSVTRGQALEDGIDELWLSDCWFAHWHDFNSWGPSRYVSLGSNPGLGEPGAQDRFDWAHLSYTNPRRAAIYGRVGGKMMPNCWGEERNEGLRGTQIMLNVHQDDQLAIEPLRWALAAAYGMTLVSERVQDPWPLRSGVDFLWNIYDLLGQTMKRTMASPDGGYGARLRERLTNEFEFGKCVKEAAACLQG